MDWETVWLRLQEIIDNEDRTRPLPDHAIAEMMGENGIIVARRTVTKYRQKMSIPSWRGRRNWRKGEK
jgi:RNA polymerase sigma-54 factor